MQLMQMDIFGSFNLFFKYLRKVYILLQIRNLERNWHNGLNSVINITKLFVVNTMQKSQKIILTSGCYFQPLCRADNHIY